MPRTNTDIARSNSPPEGATAGRAQRPRTAFVSAPTIRGRPRPSARGAPVFLLDAFRPFYLGGAIFAACAVPLWLVMWRLGHATPLPAGDAGAIAPLFWHAHEMVFGFAAAIIVGFLFTAARDWLGRPLPAGVPLALLAGLWAAGRLGMFLAYGPTIAVVDSLPLVIVAGVLGWRFIGARNVRAMPLVAVLAVLASANVLFHASMLRPFGVSPLTAIEAGFFLVVLVELIVGGRVVPGFTANAIPGLRQFRSTRLHRASFALAAAAFLSDLALAGAGPGAFPGGTGAELTGALALLAGAALAVQAVGWRPMATRGRPMLWILHLSYAWIPVGLVLLGLSSWGIVPRSASIHAFAVGSIGGLTLGMMTRTALAHSGRAVRAGPCEVSAFCLVHAAALLRVVGALAPAVSAAAVAWAGVAWSGAFLIFALAYAPLLLGAPPPRGAPPEETPPARSSTE